MHDMNLRSPNTGFCSVKKKSKTTELLILPVETEILQILHINSICFPTVEFRSCLLLVLKVHCILSFSPSNAVRLKMKQNNHFLWDTEATA